MNNLKELRNQKGITLRELESEVGIVNSTLSEIENGKRPMGPTHAKRLAPFFGVTEEYIMGDDAIKTYVRVKPAVSIRSYDFKEKKWKDLSPSELKRLSSSKSIDERIQQQFSIIDVITNKDLTDEDLVKIFDYSYSVLVSRARESAIEYRQTNRRNEE